MNTAASTAPGANRSAQQAKATSTSGQQSNNHSESTDVAALPPLIAHGRLDRLKGRLSELHTEAAVITDLVNVRWLTGFTGSNAILALATSGSQAVLVTDSRYREQAPAEVTASGCGKDVEVVVNSDFVAAVSARLCDSERLGLETTISWGAQTRWAEAFGGELVPLTEVVEELRAVKDEAELSRMAAAARIADAALAEVLPTISPGVREVEVQRALDDAMRTRGATGPAYDTIVASGPNSALPHARAGTRAMRPGDLVVIDVGAVVDGYRSDMTRTFVLGEPSAEAAGMIELVTRSQAAGVAAVRPGAEAATVDGACREVIAAGDMADAFTHGTGHGVGLCIHELPRVNRRSQWVLAQGNVLTVEPGVYVPGVGGVRVEDLVAVTGDGSRHLTGHPKDPVLAV